MIGGMPTKKEELAVRKAEDEAVHTRGLDAAPDRIMYEERVLPSRLAFIVRITYVRASRLNHSFPAFFAREEVECGRPIASKNIPPHGCYCPLRLITIFIVRRVTDMQRFFARFYGGIFHAHFSRATAFGGCRLEPMRCDAMARSEAGRGCTGEAKVGAGRVRM